MERDTGPRGRERCRSDLLNRFELGPREPQFQSAAGARELGGTLTVDLYGNGPVEVGVQELLLLLVGAMRVYSDAVWFSVAP